MRTWIEWITGSVTDWLGGIIKSLVSTQMPYLYLVLMSAALFILLYSVMFIKVKNGRVGWTAFLLSVGVLLLGIGCLVTEEPVLPENEELNGASALVERISPKGLTLDTGDTVVPAGVQFLTRRNKQYREMVRELETVINNKPVTLDKKSIPEGYLICAYDGTDLAEHLLGKGLARAGAGASDRQRRLQFEAQESRVGIWKQAWQGRTSSPFMTAFRAFGNACLVSVLFWGFLLWRLDAVSAWREDRELTRLCEKLDLMEKNHDEESKAGCGNI